MHKLTELLDGKKLTQPIKVKISFTRSSKYILFSFSFPGLQDKRHGYVLSHHNKYEPQVHNIMYVIYISTGNHTFAGLNATLHPGAPHKISVEVGRNWLLDMGFKVSKIIKGIYACGWPRACRFDRVPW